MQLLFKLPTPTDALDTIIAIATHENVTVWECPIHVEARFSDGRCFSSQYGQGARWIGDIDTTVGKWEKINIPDKMLPWGEDQAAAWCDSIVGAGYDYLGAASSATRVLTRMADRYFCSQTAIAILSRCGLLHIPEMLNPYALREFLKRLLAGESAKVLCACPQFQYTAATPATEVCYEN